MKKIWIGISLLALFFCGCQASSPSYFEEALEAETEKETVSSEEVTEHEEEGKPQDCYVYVCGAVKQPGVYLLSRGSRVYEAVAMAGGLLEGACADSINQAEEISDGQMIRIPTEEECQDASPQSGGGETEDGKVNLNTAGLNELLTLPGIGEAKAKSILSYREEQGGFSSAEELMNITGIKEGVYSKIKDYITVY